MSPADLLSPFRPAPIVGRDCHDDGVEELGTGRRRRRGIGLCQHLADALFNHGGRKTGPRPMSFPA